ncbi:hypothetical protein [Anabaena sp. CA = ATCC 33047]|uniref:hypothetical protein n=1 Tax=Anabaena sp. (strain CA / ATCC 33047) TaxID=52271 RepID=UPI0008296AEC|nr:hypothetical protein [Anabaena sp. CA = ATCC 33047]
MKNKFLALAAFGAALGSAVVAAPAHAQITQNDGPTSNIEVNVLVPEVLYLRTIENIDLEILPADLTAATLTGPLAGSVPPAYVGEDNDQAEEVGGTVNATSPFAGDFLNGTGVTKTIPSAYIVWSNSPTGSYQVQVTAPASGFVRSGAAAGAAVVEVDFDETYPVTHTAEGLVTASPKDITLILGASDDNITAGTYSGVLEVTAFRPDPAP